MSRTEIRAGAEYQGYRSRPVGQNETSRLGPGYKSRQVPAQPPSASRYAGDHSRPVTSQELQWAQGGGYHSAPVSRVDVRAGIGFEGYRSRSVSHDETDSRRGGYKSRRVTQSEIKAAED